jgi:hypothetical protein
VRTRSPRPVTVVRVGIALLTVCLLPGCVSDLGTPLRVTVTVVGVGSGTGGIVSSNIFTLSGTVERLECANDVLRRARADGCRTVFNDAGVGGTLFVTALPDDGSLLAGWTGTCSGQPDCEVTTTGDAVALEFTSGPNVTFDLTVTFDLIPEPEVGSITLAPAPFTLTSVGSPGQTVSATVLDTDGAEMQGVPLTWTSSRMDIATVTPIGTGTSATVIAVADGDAVITATAANGVSGSTDVAVAIADVPDEVIFSDMEVESEWFQTVRGSTGGVTSSATHPATGGFAGAFRRIDHDFPGAGSLSVFHGFTGETYDPSTQGAIATVRFSEYRRKILPVGSGSIGATFAILQGGTIYPLAGGLAISSEAWEARQTDLLTAADFTGGTPDFSATGGPITFGFIRSNTRGTASPQLVAHGVDDFRVEIRR